MPKSIKLRSKTLDNFRNAGCDQFQHITDAHRCDRFTTVSERYHRRDARIHAHVRGGLAEFCAIFQYDITEFSDGSHGAITPIVNNETNASPAGYDLEKPMLVRIIDLFEPKKGSIASTAFGPIYGFEAHTTPAMVWLQPLNECLMFRSEQANHFLTSALKGSPFFPLVGAIPMQEDGELETLAPCNCFAWGMQERELIDKLVKGGTQVVSNLSDIDAPFKRRWRAIHTYAVDILSRLRIELRPDDMMVSILPEGILHQSESVDLRFCAYYLETRAI
ncbi:MAG: hypothetical protein WB564_03110 [Dehalococcoidia bacterium]